MVTSSKIHLFQPFQALLHHTDFAQDCAAIHHCLSSLCSVYRTKMQCFTKTLIVLHYQALATNVFS